MSSRRTTSWKTSSQRRSRPGSAGSSTRGSSYGQHGQQQLGSGYRPPFMGTEDDTELGARNRGMRTPMSPSLSSSFNSVYNVIEEERGSSSGGGAESGGDSDRISGGSGKSHMKEKVVAEQDEDEDDFGLDDILSGITGSNKKEVAEEKTPDPKEALLPPPKVMPPPLSQIPMVIPETIVESEVSTSVPHDVRKEQENEEENKNNLKNISSLEGSRQSANDSEISNTVARVGQHHHGPQQIFTHSSKSTSSRQEDSLTDSNLTNSEDFTLSSDGDATRQHKLLAQSGQSPMFATGGFEDSTPRARLKTPQQPDIGVKASYMETKDVVKSTDKVNDHDVDSVNSFLNEVEVDLLGYQNHEVTKPDHDPEMQQQQQQQQRRQQQPQGRQEHEKTPSTLANQIPSTPDATMPASRPPTHPKIAPISGSTTNAYAIPEHRNRYDPPELEFRYNAIDPSENNQVFAEVHHHHNNQEEETLSTVTDPTESPFIYTYKKPVHDDDSVSQITSSIFGGSFASSHLQNIPSNIIGDGKSSRNRASSNLSWMGGTSVTGSRISHRKRPNNPNRRTSQNGSSNGSSGSNPILELDYGGNDEGSQNGLDEIQFALNSDTVTSRNQRARRPQTRGTGCPISLAEISSVCSADDASTLDSRQASFARNRRVVTQTDYSDNVSKLGLGGVSCAGQSGSANTSVSESTKSPKAGVLQGLIMMARQTQHRVARFFLPHSAKVERRKKYDRSDSVDSIEDMLLEEGSGRPRRHQEDEDVDYFSRAMSTTASNSYDTNHSRKSKQGGERSGFGITQLVSAFLLITVALTVYRGNIGEEEEPFQFNFAKQNPPGVHPMNSQNLRSMEGEDTEDHERNDVGLDPLKERNKIISKKGDDDDDDKTEILRLINSKTMEQDSLEAMGNLRPKPPDPVVQLPSSFESLVNVDELPFQRGIDIPFYWHIPRSGGGTVNDVLGSCLKLTLAADAGASEGHGHEDSLKKVTFARSVTYVNVDTSTHQGIERAKKLNLASSGLVDVVISPLLHDASSLFTSTRRGRMFTIIRHPVERAASLFYFIQDTQWKQPITKNDQFADISIENFYKGGFAENNWMTRFLTNELTKGELTDDDLLVAKEVLKKKCLIGLLEEKAETFDRIEKYFGWKPKNSSEQECLEKKLEWAWPMKHRHYNIEEGTDAWYLIANQNKLDLQLYQYAKELFQKQAELFERKKVG
mmetsp:Transcript_9242/g.18447  ORF Transcript_9242/g.18447 Transcript_9242/m.18447 type:complete len:1209 (+) Transcript_9242:186-3812(+)